MANRFYLDASALAKRYVPEPGSPQVHAILDTLPGDQLSVLNIGTGEVVSILIRKRNARVISDAYFTQALIDFEKEIVHSPTIAKVSITNRLVLASFRLIVAHSLNSTDALVLKSALVIARKARAYGDDLVLVASDLRLLRAAQAEGLITFDPERQDQAALEALLAS